MFPRMFKSAVCCVMVLGCAFIACSVTVSTNDDGGGSVAFTIGATTFKIDFGGEAVFDVTADGPPVEKVFAVQLFDETPADAPQGASLILEAESVQFIPASPSGKAVDAAQSQETPAASVDVYMADSGTANPCANGVYVGTYQVFLEPDAEQTDLRVPDALMATARSGIINLCLRVTVTRDGRVVITQVLIRFDETELTDIDNGNANDNQNVNDNANDNTADNENANDNTADNLNDNGGDVGGGIFTGCWEMNIWWDGTSEPGDADFVLSVDAFDNVERMWQHWLGGTWNESVRFTVPNSPYWDSMTISTSQSVTFDPADATYTIALGITSYGGSYNYLTEQCEANLDTTGVMTLTYSDLVFDSDSPDSFSGNFTTTIEITTTSGDAHSSASTGTVTGARTTCPPPGAVPQEDQEDPCLH